MKDDENLFLGDYGAARESQPDWGNGWREAPTGPAWRPEPPPVTQPVTATITHKREPIHWGRLFPYLMTIAGLALIVAGLVVTMNWRTEMQNQVNDLRHQVAAVQAQAVAGDAQVSQGVTRLSRTVGNVRSRVSAVSAQVGPFSSQCIGDLTGPAGVAAYVVPCRR
jgi:hypothetical protein